MPTLSGARYVVHEAFYWDPSFDPDEDNPDREVAATRSKPTEDVEFYILQGLQGKEKEYVLWLGESFESLIRDGRTSVVTITYTPYQRFLVYCCSVYYGLAFGIANSRLEIYNVRTPSSHIPQRRISDMIPPDLAAAATNFSGPKHEDPIVNNSRLTIAKRQATGAHYFIHFEEKEENGQEDEKIQSKSTPDPAMDNSNGIEGRNGDSSSDIINANGKRRLIMEDREAGYKEARARIFMDFDEKEKMKDSDRKYIRIGERDGDPSASEPGGPDASISNDQLNPKIRFQKDPLPTTGANDEDTDAFLNSLPTETLLAALMLKRYGHLNDTHIGSAVEEENSESASITGSGSIYSHASSRTKSTDYGIYYRRMALSQESLVEATSEASR